MPVKRNEGPVLSPPKNTDQLLDNLKMLQQKSPDDPRAMRDVVVKQVETYTQMKGGKMTLSRGHKTPAQMMATKVAPRLTQDPDLRNWVRDALPHELSSRDVFAFRDRGREAVVNGALEQAIRSTDAITKNFPWAADAMKSSTLHESLAVELDIIVTVALQHSMQGSKKTYESTSKALASKPAAFAQMCGSAALLVERLVELHAANIESLVHHVHEDLPRLQRAFFGDVAAARLTSIEVMDSDPHHGRRRVAALKFRLVNGNDVQVLYKPRSVAIDAKLFGKPDGTNAPSLAALLSGFLSESDAITQHTLVDCQDHGYAQFLTHDEEGRTLRTKTEAVRYYRDFGRIAAVALLAGVTDLHQSNVLVSGKRPYVIDAEIAFHPQARDLANTHLFKALSQDTERHIDQFIEHKPENEAPTLTWSMTRRRTNNAVVSEEGESGPSLNVAYRANVLEGFGEVLEVAKQAKGRAAIDSWLNDPEMPNTSVRFHPRDTPTQLRRLQGALYEKMPTADAAETFQALSADIIRVMKPSVVLAESGDENRPNAGLVDSMLRQLVEDGSVPYFTRRLGSADIEDDRGVVKVESAPAGDTMYFKSDAINPQRTFIQAVLDAPEKYIAEASTWLGIERPG